MLIETYINWLGEEESVESREESEIAAEEIEPVHPIGNAKEIRAIISQEMGDLFNEQKEKSEIKKEPPPVPKPMPRIRKLEDGEIHIFSVEKSEPGSEEDLPHSDIKPDEGS